MAKQGKCSNCRTRWTWDKEMKIEKCHCPTCGKTLEVTSNQSSYTHVHMEDYYFKTEKQLTKLNNNNRF